ncbi:DUF722 domain-containing protein [Weissella diestrammenae]|uniref:DUF722 domain-containing protein n=1 Tax=Weissella diestrammenae TaxID=1162633 RepID=A0A7G9T4H6_9LACO|nr:DUF722 domain-containing protein [Weissella diestrammenae]MCM0582135.1 DUF722 domain-containing protein [Weissella diestrammenae]QNN75001.1 DUF722 domain-containing protein [Weissella diestrammenae]
MAIRYRNVLELYFSGRLSMLIALREVELGIKDSVDENVGGSRTQFKYNKPAEDTMIAIDEDKDLTLMKHQKRVLDFVASNWSDEKVSALREHYGFRRATWTMIAMQHSMTESGIRFWRDGFIKEIEEFNLLGETKYELDKRKTLNFIEQMATESDLREIKRKVEERMKLSN